MLSSTNIGPALTSLAQYTSGDEEETETDISEHNLDIHDQGFAAVASPQDVIKSQRGRRARLHEQVIPECPVGLITEYVPSQEILMEWLERHDVQYSREVKIVQDEQSGWGLQALMDLSRNQPICRIPKTAILSHRTSSLNLTQVKDGQYDSMTTHSTWFLALALLHEFRLGTESNFWGYIQSLPRETILLPLFWDIEKLCGEDGRIAAKLLEGTEVGRILNRQRAEGRGIDDLRNFYDLYAPHLPSTSSYPDPSPFLDFLHAYALVSTRAFVIDVYHTVALCPFADILNHSHSPHTSLSSDDFVCHICGALGECEHDIPNSLGVPRRLEHLSEVSRRKLEKEVDTVDLTVEVDLVKAGEEVFNSYGGTLSSAQLLLEWGFYDGKTGEKTGCIVFEEEEINSNARNLDTQQMWETMREDDQLPSGEDLPRMISPGIDGTPLGIDSSTGSINLRMWFEAFQAIIAPDSARDGSVRIEDFKRSIAELVVWEKAKQVQDPLLFDSFHQYNALWMSAETINVAEKVYEVLEARLKGLRVPDTKPAAGLLSDMAWRYADHERNEIQETARAWKELLDVFKATGPEAQRTS